MRVFVLLFVDPQTKGEGIYSLKLGDRNTILMFESEDDATRYGLLLEAQDFLSPTVEEIDSEEIEEFCNDADYDCKLVPEGTLAVPPETNLEQMDWQAEEKLDGSLETDSEMSLSELEQIRRRLEGLL
ncbi:DUF3110 domain-containing protein [Leptolyngbya ohadii]|uniref:DUF3110 domain-containing protein n=1 Tax=Leptolyngbya ohadii TaxID=1962290 RepID=UPI000B59ED03|nr:DUF3110 domain-containing protein [Leptolyngbya ohadii]